MRRRGYLLAALALVVVATGAVVVAGDTDPLRLGEVRTAKSIDDLPIIRNGPQPSLAQGNGFLNGKPKVAGKVVVYDFWTYSCVNCVRTLPHIESWHQRYAADGLVVVGVHSPEFDFEKIHGNVRKAVDKLDVSYPVVFDDDMRIWRAFRNQYWPAKYIADRNGDVRFLHIGEGNYDDTETVIRLLLGVADDAPRASPPGGKESRFGADITRETYLGRERGGTDNVRRRGEWSVHEDFIESKESGASVELTYKAGEVNLVLDRTSKKPVPVLAELDGKPLPRDVRGASVVERGGRTFVDVDAADMYRLVLGGPDGNHKLTLRPQGPGVRAYAFTFGG